MYNCIYKFDRRVVNSIEVTDYTSVYYGALIEVFKSYPDYFMVYETSTDEKIENISYNLYGSENYADIILLSSGIIFLWGSNYNSDVILEQSEAFQRVIVNELNIENNSSQDIIDVFNGIDDKISDINSKKKILTVPKPENLNMLLSIVDNYREKNRLKDIIISE